MRTCKEITSFILPILPRVRKSIDIEGLLVWAFKHCRVHEYVEQGDYHGHRVRDAVPMEKQLKRLEELGVRVDCSGVVTDWDMHPDALAVMMAVKCLGVDERRLVIEYALYGTQPEVPRLKYVPVSGGKNATPIKMVDGVNVEGVTRYHEWCDKTQSFIKRKVAHPVVRIGTKLSTKEMRDIIQERVNWCYALKKLSECQFEFVEYEIIKGAVPLSKVSRLPEYVLAKLDAWNDKQANKC